MAMDKNGIIYVATANTIFALGYSTELTVEAENATVFDDEIITVTVADGATGNVTIIVIF